MNLKLVPKNSNVDFIDIVTKISNGQDINLSDYDVYSSHNSFLDYINEIQNHLVENGMSSLMTIEPIFEHVVAKGEKKEIVIRVLQRYLDKIHVDNELIIIDPYFFANTNDESYPQTVFDILEKYLESIDVIEIITNNKVDNTLKSSIESKLKTAKPELIIQHKISQDYHDRFWISNKREKGIVTGTSLNGLGKNSLLLTI